jgi:hypothetical protein
MDQVCLVVNPEHKDKSAPKLVEQIQKLGLHCIQAAVAQPGFFAIGWGRPGGLPGLNCERPHNKLWEMKRLRDHGVRTVPFDVQFKDAVARAWDDLRAKGKRAALFGRLKNHSQGKDIFPFELTEDSREKQLAVECKKKRDFWTQVVPRVAEFRVHAFCRRVDHAAEKVPISEEARAALIWNQKNCTYEYSNPVPEAAKNIAIDAVAEYGLDFGAVDVLQDVNGDCYVLEVNLRPGLNEDMVIYYATKMAEAAKAVR